MLENSWKVERRGRPRQVNPPEQRPRGRTVLFKKGTGLIKLRGGFHGRWGKGWVGHLGANHRQQA